MQKSNNKIGRLLLIGLLIVFGKFLHAQKIVLISKDKNKNIENWLLRADPNLIIKEFYFLSNDSQTYYLSKASGIVIGGGEDIHPNLYGKPEAIEICGKIDNYRDSIELVLIAKAREKKIPLFGICRGLQIINVQYGGTLISDIPSEKQTKINHSQPGIDSVHWILASKETGMMKNIGESKLMVNSSHHQCINKLAKPLKAIAYSEDGIVEAIETKETKSGFVCAIQWHPERLNNNPSLALSNYFLQAVSTKYSSK